MSRSSLTKAEMAAILDDLLANQNCANGCKCIFCRVFDEGVQSGKHDAEIHFRRSLEEFAQQNVPPRMTIQEP